jgi:hypothetical protein
VPFSCAASAALIHINDREDDAAEWKWWQLKRSRSIQQEYLSSMDSFLPRVAKEELPIGR